MPAMERAMIRATPPGLRTWLVMRLARKMIRNTYRAAAPCPLAQGRGRHRHPGIDFCEVRDRVEHPLCEFYASAIRRLCTCSTSTPTSASRNVGRRGRPVPDERERAGRDRSRCVTVLRRSLVASWFGPQPHPPAHRAARRTVRSSRPIVISSFHSKTPIAKGACTG